MFRRPAQPSDERRDAAEVVAALAERLRERVGDVATLELRYEPERLADLSVVPADSRALVISIVGVGGGFVVAIGPGFKRVELENNPPGRDELENLVAAAIEGRAWGRKHSPYRTL